MTGLLFKRDEANKADLRRRRGEYHFGLKWGEKVERAALFQINYSTSRGAPFSGGTQRCSNAAPLRVPACRFRAVEQLTFVFAPVNFRRKVFLDFG